MYIIHLKIQIKSLNSLEHEVLWRVSFQNAINLLFFFKIDSIKSCNKHVVQQKVTCPCLNFGNSWMVHEMFIGGIFFVLQLLSICFVYDVGLHQKVTSPNV